MDPKEYEKYARMYGITDYRGILQAIEQLKRERAEVSSWTRNNDTIALSCTGINPNIVLSEYAI